jgi:hypothetical protein
MKILNFFLTFGFMLGLFSCETDTNLNHSVFRLEFSDGTEIVKSDIQFYDSATHFIFLKKNLDFNQTISGFSVLVNNDTIYKGIKHSCMLSTRPPSTFFITDCFFYGNDIVDIGFYPYSNDLRNDQRIIDALKDDNLLRNGLSCSIDSIKVNSFDDYSEVFCKITITNHDKINYYVLDPGKMGELDFNYFTGGLLFQNIDTKLSSFLRWSISNPDWGDLTMNDFTILSGNSKISYTFKSSDYYKMDKGFYKATFSFCGTKHNTKDFDLVQDDGRIWVGSASSEMDSIVVK